MATLTVWKFPTADAADRARDTLASLQQEDLINILDAAVVTWPADARKPKTRQAFSPTVAGASGGAFWGLLFGLIFFVPFFGLAVGAAIGALSGSLVDFGIDDRFIESVRAEVTPGTSALFLMSSDAVVDKVRAAFAGEELELLATNLSVDDEDALREMFAD
jgi:uncharacterized membrane protein